MKKFMTQGMTLCVLVGLCATAQAATLAEAIDMSGVTVKAEFAEEVLDTKKGAVIELNATSPVLTTANTRPGLVYTLREGTTLETMASGASTVGDGQPWTPAISVKGGISGFYSIEVSK